MNNKECILEMLEAYREEDIYPFHMPGHKRNTGLMGNVLPYSLDITEITGFDNLHHPEGILKEAQDNASHLFGTCKTFFSVNGSSACLLAAISAAFRKGDRVLVARNCHKSVYHALYLRELIPVYLYPETFPAAFKEQSSFPALNGGISLSKTKELLDAFPDIRGMILTSPTYDGIVSDVKGIASLLHERGLILIVDEAHGAHFPFSGFFPASAIACGADIVIHSIHKTLPSLTQTALLHLCTKQADPGRVQRFLSIYQSSSPSYPLMASIDFCLRMLQKSGTELFHAYEKRLSHTRDRLSACRRFRLISPEAAWKTSAAVFDYDRSKLVISAAGSGISGHELFSLLRSRFRLEPEMEAPDYVLAMTSLSDTEEGLNRLCKAMEELESAVLHKSPREASGLSVAQDTGKEEHARTSPYMNKGQTVPERHLEMHEALEMASARCPLEISAGKISGEFITLYPPGIPLLVPGEEISEELLTRLLSYRKMGLTLQGPADSSCKEIRVIRNT